jgi:integrase/recombinase XerD
LPAGCRQRLAVETERLASLPPKPRSSLPRFFTEEQIQKLLALPGLSPRDRAILEVLVATGLRASELLALVFEDVAPDCVFVRHGKGGRQRFVPLSKRAFEALGPLLARCLTPDDSVFVNAWGAPLSRRGLHDIVKAHLRASGLKGSCHTLRHSLATNLLNRGLDLRSVQAILGHADLDTTSVYLHCATKRLCDDYQRVWG